MSENHEMHPHHIHIGMRKVKSLLAIVIGFVIWQGVRLFFPDLEVHPLFIYIYGVMEIRETSEKTKTFGMQRIRATAVAMIVGLPMLLLWTYIHNHLRNVGWVVLLDLVIVLVGVLVTLQLGEKFKCGSMISLASAIYVVLLLYHADDTRYLYAVVRASETVIGVLVAWFVNVILLPYPARKKSKTKESES